MQPQVSDLRESCTALEEKHSCPICKFGVGCTPLVFPQITWMCLKEAQGWHFLLLRKLWQTGNSFNAKYSSFPALCFCPFFSLSICLMKHKVSERQEDFKIKEAFVLIVFFYFPL